MSLADRVGRVATTRVHAKKESRFPGKGFSAKRAVDRRKTRRRERTLKATLDMWAAHYSILRRTHVNDLLLLGRPRHRGAVVNFARPEEGLPRASSPSTLRPRSRSAHKSGGRRVPCRPWS